MLKSQFERFPLGDYDAEPRTADGRVDVEKLITLLVKAHVNTYDFLIYNGANDWSDLQKFLPLAQGRGISVWVTLVPPSEPPPSQPFQYDFINWAKNIAELSLRHPNLVAFVIDDFERLGNLSTFTPEYVAKMADAYRAINPKLAFFPCIYSSTPKARATNGFMAKYGQSIDGVMYAFVNLDSTAALAQELQDCREMLGKEKLLMVNIYAAETSWHKDPPKSDYLVKAVEIARTATDGIRIYCLPKDESNALYETVRRLFTAMNPDDGKSARKKEAGVL
jgi:hypothetical protein